MMLAPAASADPIDVVYFNGLTSHGVTASQLSVAFDLAAAVKLGHGICKDLRSGSTPIDEGMRVYETTNHRISQAQASCGLALRSVPTVRSTPRMFTARTAQEVMMKRLTGVPLNRGYLAVTSVMLGALLIGGGTGTAHAYTDSDTAEQPPNTVRS